MKKTKTVVQRCYTPYQQTQIKRLLGKNLKIARENAGLSQTEVMMSLWGNDKNRNRISEIENGHAQIDIFQFLLLINLYGQSADYVLGRSCEPVNDVLAAHINHVRINTKHYLEPVIDAMTKSVVDAIGKIDKDEHFVLIERAKNLVAYLLEHGKSLKQDYPVLHQMLLGVEQSVRTISVNEARRQRQMQAQLDDIAKRYDEGHLLLEDLHKSVQYPLPLPEPVGVEDGTA